MMNNIEVITITLSQGSSYALSLASQMSSKGLSQSSGLITGAFNRACIRE
jgi:hypothetical protein